MRCIKTEVRLNVNRLTSYDRTTITFDIILFIEILTHTQFKIRLIKIM